MQPVKKILIVTADACYAEFYIAHGPHNLSKIERVENPAARLHEHDYTTKDHDVNTCPYEGSIKKMHEEEVFAKQLTLVIDKLLETEHMNEVCIFAAPKFLGMLKHDKYADHPKITWIAKNFLHQAEDLQVIQHAVANAGLNFLP